MITIKRILSRILVILIILSINALPQGCTSVPKPTNFTKAELDQMLAPIALYPDSLLSQILMASTYPIEVVDADRWVKQQPNLTGDQLDQALVGMNWDMSVKSLTHFPAVLSQMSLNIDETTRLGNAFLNQQQDVIDAIQELRAKAVAQGYCNTTEQQTVTVNQGYIKIAPPNPNVLYVPVYNPTVVYGPWLYPAYPPYVWNYGAPIIGAGVSFGVGIFIGSWVGSWSGFNWDSHNVYVTNYYGDHGGYHGTYNNGGYYNGNHHYQGGGSYNGGSSQTQVWVHNPEHRRGVAYLNSTTSQRLGQTTTGTAGYNNQYLGHGSESAKHNITQGQSTKHNGANNVNTFSSSEPVKRSVTQGQSTKHNGANNVNTFSSSEPVKHSVTQGQSKQHSGVSHGNSYNRINKNNERTAGQRSKTTLAKSYGDTKNKNNITHGSRQGKEEKTK